MEIDSLLLWVTLALNPIGHIIFPFASSIQQPDQILTVYITGLPVLDLRQPMGSSIINPTGLNGKLLLIQIQQKPIILWIPIISNVVL